VIVIGLLSGTSYDAIESAAADFTLEGDELLMRPVGAISVPYAPATHDAIGRALPPASVRVEAVAQLDTLLGQEFAAVAERVQNELCAGRAELITSHGQTLFHWVEEGEARGSLQLGQSAWIASRTGLPVVSDLRAADIAAGGQGAPLASTFDHLLLGGSELRRAALNLGGIANLTIVGGGLAPVAYDTGPANALIDAAVHHFSSGRESFDRDGEHARSGRVDAALLDDLLAHPYYAQSYPKSTGKEQFNVAYLTATLATHESTQPDDVITTLTLLSARTIARELIDAGVAEVFASGGGTKNPTLMDLLRSEANEVVVRGFDELGVSTTAKEAYVFALLGWLTWHGLAGTIPSCTGARYAPVLGRISPGADPLRLPPPLERRPSRMRIVPAVAP
jgi:anhydro-N-acetylmuramic acid kinase